MPYKIEIRRAPQREIVSLPKESQRSIARVIDTLANEPRPHGCRRLRESGLWRIRSGQYRVIYTIDDKAQVITVVRVAIRQENTYKQL